MTVTEHQTTVSSTMLRWGADGPKYAYRAICACGWHSRLYPLAQRHVAEIQAQTHVNYHRRAAQGLSVAATEAEIRERSNPVCIVHPERTASTIVDIDLHTGCLEPVATPTPAPSASERASGGVEPPETPYTTSRRYGG